MTPGGHIYERVYTILCQDQGVMLTYLLVNDKISRHGRARKLATPGC
jgi:hypothetical protein